MEVPILGKYGRYNVLLTHDPWRRPTSEGHPVPDLGKLLKTRQFGCHSATLAGYHITSFQNGPDQFLDLGELLV